MKIVKIGCMAVFVGVLGLTGCSKEEEAPEPSAVEEAGKELGQAVTRDLKEEIEQAEAVEAQAQQAAENLDKKIEEQTSEP